LGQGFFVVGRKHTEEQFRILFEAAPIGVMAVDGAGRIVLLNAQAEKMFGYPREDLIGQPVEVLVPQRFRRGHADLRKSAAAARMRPMGTNRDFFGVRKDGSEFPIEVGLNPIVMSMGEVVIATVVDITERKQAEEREMLLEHARAKLETCQQLGVPAAVLQPDGRVLLLNPLLEKLSSQFELKHDRIELSNATANNFFFAGGGQPRLRKHRPSCALDSGTCSGRLSTFDFSPPAHERSSREHPWHSGRDNAWFIRHAVR
jgi:PAS domain S-box-containing protein